MKLDVKKILAILIIVLVFIFMLILNSNTSLVTDDFIYQFVFTNRYPQNNTKLITNFFDLFISMSNHWNLWGGRVVVHFLLQLSFIFGIWFFNIINSVMFIMLGILIYKHIIYNKKDVNLLLLIFIYASIFIFVPQPGSTILWKSGSANYLWSSVLILFITLKYRNNFIKSDEKSNVIKNILYLVYGIIVGCCNENAGCALIVCIILFMICNKIKTKVIPKWMIFNLVGTVCGYIFLLIAPGNYIRAEQMYSNVDYSFTSLIEYFLKITRLSYEYLHIIIILTIITLVLVYVPFKNIKDYIDKYGLQTIFIVFALISVYSLIISPAYPERCWMFAFDYLIIIIGINIISLINNDKFKTMYKKIFIIGTIILVLEAVSLYNEAYYDILSTKECIEDHQIQIRDQIRSGKKDVVVHSIPESVGRYNSFTYNGYLTYNPDSWTNRWIAKYYGANSIVIED